MCISCLHIFAEARAARVSNGTILLYFAKNPLILYCITRKNGETRPRGARRPGLGVIKGIGGRIRYTRAQRRRRESVRAGAGCVSSVRASACQAGGGKAREFNGDEIRKLSRHDLLNCELVAWCPLGVEPWSRTFRKLRLHTSNCTQGIALITTQPFPAKQL